MTHSAMRTTTWKAAALATAVALGLAACGGKSGDKAGAAAGQQAPAPVVSVVTVQPETVTLQTDLPARLEARRTADVRAQVGGIIQRRLFQEGAFVRAGQPLYQLDASTYEANLYSARASLASAQASLAKANADLTRYKPLVEADAISKQDYDAAVAAKRAAEAGVESAKASIASAQISLNRSRITAPISGVIGASKVSEGTLLAAGDTTVLATITQSDPMFVNITQSAADVLKLRRQYAQGQVQAVGKGGMDVEIVLEDGTVYPQKGRLIFADMTVDESTGQVQLRAEVPNPDLLLMPNLYVRVRLPLADMDNVYKVPQQAVTRGKSDSVLVVNADGSMAPRPVKVAGEKDGYWLITEGLKAGDKVIVDGTMIAGMSGAKTVTPKEWTPPAAQAAAAQTAAPAAASAASAGKAAVQTASDVQTASAPKSAAASAAKQ